MGGWREVMDPKGSVQRGSRTGAGEGALGCYYVVDNG